MAGLNLWHSPRDPTRVALRALQPGGAKPRLEIAVEEALATNVKVVAIQGSVGGGSSLALSYLRRVLSGLAHRMFSGPTQAYIDWVETYPNVVPILEHEPRCTLPDAAAIVLAPWGVDECVEWTIGVPKERRASFLARARGVLDLGVTTPVVLAAVWDVMEQQESIQTLDEALRVIIEFYAKSAKHRESILAEAFRLTVTGAAPQSPQGLLVDRRVQQSFAVEHVVEALATDDFRVLRTSLPVDLIARVGDQLKSSPEALGRLRYADRHSYRLIAQATAASLLVAADCGWMPDPKRMCRFDGAYLAGAKWAGAMLNLASLKTCDFTGANLSSANLSHTDCTGVMLSRADLASANFSHAKCVRSSLEHADLRRASLHHSKFSYSKLDDADLSECDCDQTMFDTCSFRRACLRRARMVDCQLLSCECADADMSAASFKYSRLQSIDLRAARVNDLDVDYAEFTECNLANLRASAIRGQRAVLQNCDLTGTLFRGATFARACFKNCGLAEIWWEGADLRDVDFSGSTFHMGSSRCGLVGSPLASEGTRTGFYTDDYAAQDYRPPEEIAKADLRGCDLRGAKVDGVDFYLVDLRGAVYEPEQAEWFKRCGAILYARV